jgi:hypothetical protein
MISQWRSSECMLSGWETCSRSSSLTRDRFDHPISRLTLHPRVFSQAVEDLYIFTIGNFASIQPPWYSPFSVQTPCAKHGQKPHTMTTKHSAEKLVALTPSVRSKPTPLTGLRRLIAKAVSMLLDFYTSTSGTTTMEASRCVGRKCK